MGNAAAIIETVKDLQEVVLLEADGIQFASVPDGRKLESIKGYIDEYRDTPERKKGTALLTEPAAFVEYVNRHKNESTVCFATATRQNPSITAIIDYHEIDGTPRFGEHRAFFGFPLSDEWKAWTGSAGHNFKQKEFVEFLEDRIMDLAQPSVAGERTKEYVKAIECELATPTQVASVARSLELTVDQKIVQQTKTGSGESQFVFKEVHKDVNGAPVRVPGAFLIAIPIFTGGEGAVLPVRLRYKVNKETGEVLWHYALALVEELFKLAINAEIAKIHAGIERPIYIGSPER
jgi:uncharacterized protein YfdQ (DUF2303 family)